MDFTYESQGTNTYLVYKMNKNEEIDSLSFGMLTNNRICGLAAIVFNQMNEDRFFKYNVSSKVSVQQFFTGLVNRKRLLGVFGGIVDAILNAEEYMIDTKNIVLDLNYVFTDVTSCETVLICLPIKDEARPQADLEAIFKSIVFGTRFDQTESCDYVAKLINYLNAAPFSLTGFKEVLDELNGKEVQAAGITAADPNFIQNPLQQINEQKVMLPQNTDGSQIQLQQKMSPMEISDNTLNDSVPETADKKLEKTRKKSTVVNASQQTSISQEDSDGKEKTMSMLYLLSHYSKENAALYKQQKNSGKQIAKGAPINVLKNNQLVKPEFAIPGQQDSKVQPPTVVSMQTRPQDHVPSAAPAQPVVKPKNFGETTVLGVGNGVGETTVLSAMVNSSDMKPRIIRSKTNESIIIDKPIFRIGKERSYVDYFIGDNAAISRSHANIVKKDGEYFIMDTNSTNHTYVNGNMIQSNVEIKITHGTKIQLSNEEFEFRLYE